MIKKTDFKYTLFYTKQWNILAKCIQLTYIILVQAGSSNVTFNPFSYIFIHITIPKMLILMDYDVFNALRIYLYISQNVNKPYIPIFVLIKQRGFFMSENLELSTP